MTCLKKENSCKTLMEAKSFHFHYQDFNGHILILTITHIFKTSAIIVFAKQCVHSSLE